MSKRLIAIVLLVFAVLVGCSNEETSKKEVPESKNSNQEIRLPMIDIIAGDIAGPVYKDVWCLKEESLCSLTPNPPQEVVSSNPPPLRVRPGDVFQISITTDSIPESKEIYTPDISELKLWKGNEELTVEATDYQITAPMEEGLYYYSMKLQWDGYYTGQAYYAFSLRVQ
ncbi:hypothetical protein [Ornithinibacillus scapharcae]|uniref:hypothetical protein n=1 Tax=Ornithinibacillus scapharcae TaxID=1147159 RepID=UPI000225B578|nr:hypothetical protein [Ornithinibacillus scapharcae]